MSTTSRHGRDALPLEGLRSDYDMANRQSRFRKKRTGVTTVGTSGDYHYRNEPDFLYAIELGRDMDRNDCIAGVALDRLESNVFQDGIDPEPATGSDALDDALKENWTDWASDEDRCDIAGEHTFKELEKIAFRSTLVDGDIIALPNESGALELVEAHRCRTPSNTNRNVVHGVLLSQSRKHLEYWFTRDEIDPSRAFAKVSDAVPVKVRDKDGVRQVFHLYNPTRVSQTRGVSVFRRCADMVGMHDDIQFANLVKQQVASCFGFIRERAAGNTGGGLPGDLQTGARTVESTPQGKRVIDNISPGMQVTTDPGEKLVPFSPDIHNPQFFEHVMLVLRIIAANLNLPIAAILLDASETNYSGWRGAIDQAKTGFRNIQNWNVRKLHSRVYRWKARSFIDRSPALKKMAAATGVKPLGVEWHLPVWDYIDPLKDAAGDAAQISSMTISPREVMARRGRKIDTVYQDIVADNARLITLAKDAARELNQGAEDTEKVSWRELLVIPGPNNLAINLAAAVQSQFTDGNTPPQRAPADE